jgi:hypothetical protein
MLRSTSLVIAIALAFGAGQVASSKDDDTPKPPSGFKEYAPKDGTFAVWVPEKPRSQRTSERTITLNGTRLKINLLMMEMQGGPLYVVEELIVPAKLKPADLASGYKDFLVSELKGKVTEEGEIKVGAASGEEFRIESASNLTRARSFATATRVLVLRITGKKDAIDGDAAKVFLESARFTKPMGSTPGSTTGSTATGNAPSILGGASFDPEFKDVAPDGGLLIGFEVGTVKRGNRDTIKAGRPIYRVGDKETMGEQRGTQLNNVVTLKAKPGYAVGAISLIKAGFNLEGMSVTFMKVVGDKLDPKDSYESESVGTNEKKNLTKLGGNGTPVVGIVGKSNNRDMTGIGLLLKGQEGYEPKKQ